MGRNVVHKRIVRGKEVTADEFRRQLFEAACSFDAVGGAVPEIMDYLEIENDRGVVRDMVRDTLADMCVRIGAAEQAAEREKAKAKGRKPRHKKRKIPLLERVAHGRYAALTDELPARDVSPSARLRRDMDDVLCAHGGFIREKDALEAFDCRPTVARADEQALPLPDGSFVRRDLRKTTEYMRVRSILRTNYTKMRSGVYFIGDEKMSGIVLMGRWCQDYFAHQALVRDRLDNGIYACEPHFTRRFYRHFLQLGALTEDLIDRQHLNWVIDLARDPALAEALLQWTETAEAWPQRQTFNRAICRKDDGNIFSDYVDNYGSPLAAARHYVDRHFPDDPTFHNDGLALFRHFCDGYRSAHETAPIALYKALANIFQIDPILYSRGFEWTVIEHHLRTNPVAEGDDEAEEIAEERLENVTSMCSLPADASAVA